MDISMQNVLVRTFVDGDREVQTYIEPEMLMFSREERMARNIKGDKLEIEDFIVSVDIFVFESGEVQEDILITF